ncbi:MAG: FGGY-family carbohydrate kinase, partial [Chloroflexota bacterium]
RRPEVTGQGPMVIGLDIGTQGVRAVAVGEDGSVLAQASAAHSSQRPFAGAMEQHPDDWWRGIVSSIRSLREDVDLGSVRAVSTSSTSGTLCLLDASGSAVRPAIIYSDSRARSEAEELSATEPLERPVRETDALAKAMWVRRHEPDTWRQVAAMRSPSGYVSAALGGRLLPFDHTQATKFGWDPLAMRWPRQRLEIAGLPETAETEVVEPGRPIATISTRASAELGLPGDTAIVAGATDGVCGFLACRPALRVGCTILGTTIVWKTLSSRHVPDEQGIYSHKGMGGRWLPGAASNSGGGILESIFPGRDPAEMGRGLELPAGGLLYPLPGQGERFPFRDPDAVSFRILPDRVDEASLFAACLEGVAYVERWGYERLESLGLIDPQAGLTSAGGATRSEQWLRIRASVLRRPISVPLEPGSAYGAALLASAALGQRDPFEVAQDLVRFRITVQPVAEWADRYDDLYARFREAARARGWN